MSNMVIPAITFAKSLVYKFGKKEIAAAGMLEDGTVYSVYSFARKVGQALADGIGVVAFGSVGYDAARSVQSKEALESIWHIHFGHFSSWNRISAHFHHFFIPAE